MQFSDTIFEALSSSVRRQILVDLSDAELKAGDISSHFKTSRASISQHLAILEAAGLVSSERRGQFIFYRQIDDTLLNTLHCFMHEVCPRYRAMWHGDVDPEQPSGVPRAPMVESLRFRVGCV